MHLSRRAPSRTVSPSACRALVVRPSARLTAQVVPREQAVPAFEARYLPGRGTVRIDAAPRFRRRVAVQVLVWPNRVVPEPERRQQPVQRESVFRHDLVQLLLQGQEQAFDAPVLPRLAGSAEFVADAQVRQALLEDGAPEDLRIVGAQEARLAEQFDRQRNFPQDRRGSGVFQPFKNEIQARAVIDDAQDVVIGAGSIPLAGAIEAPAQVGQSWSSETIPGRTAYGLHVGTVFLHPGIDGVQAHRHAAMRMQAIERVHGAAIAAGLGMQAQHFLDHPARLGPAARAAVRRGTKSFARCAGLASVFSAIPPLHAPLTAHILHPPSHHQKPVTPCHGRTRKLLTSKVSGESVAGLVQSGMAA